MPSYTHLVLPPTSGRREQLEAKLEEYRTREGEGWLRMCKITVLETLLTKAVPVPRQNGPVWVTSDMLREAFKEADREHLFGSPEYYEAFLVIQSYAKDGGSNVMGGTGLPNISA